MARRKPSRLTTGRLPSLRLFSTLLVKNLFVGNLGSEVTHEELRRLFEAYGQVVQVHIIVDRDTGLPRGFAFVEMTNDAEAEKAIQALNGSILRDRTLDVNYARPRPERPAA